MHDRLVELLEPLVESLGYELVLLEFNAHKGSALVRLFIDAVGGVSLGDCEKVSREVEGRLDVEDPIAQNYRLEVSSPGLDRPLVKPDHFERFAGQVARVQLTAPQAGRRKFEGVLRGLRNDAVVLETTDAGTIEVQLGNIERARLVPDYEKELRGS
ncbi:MAG TPA: ribosome maturation factor RimP [Verrucomicrobiae bacterium]|nr:ribosome maturation factor RimP [Verrucomicrobiae bacterium]